MPGSRSARHSTVVHLSRVIVATVVGYAILYPSLSLAQTVDTVVARELGPGVIYRKLVDRSGPFTINLVRVDLRRRDIELRAVRAHDALKGREKPSDMVRRIASEHIVPLVAVNGDFFELKSGENENNQVIDGEWWKGLKVTDSPYDTYDNVHVQFALDDARHPFMDRYILDARAIAHGLTTPIVSLNFNPSGNPEGTALYTQRYGAMTPRDTTRQTAEAALVGAGRRGDTLLFIRRDEVVSAGGSPIPAGGAVLSAYGTGARTKEIQTMAVGDTIKVLLTTLPRLPRASPTIVIGGWPRILRDGEIVAGEAPTVEGTISRNAETRHARTSIGFSRDSTTLFLMTVDGRSTQSVGMTLVELATFMRAAGAWQAMNFDGGGSTTMVVDGTLANAPSDSTGERAVGNALLVVRRK